ncbi:MAG: hypothetical protein JNK49_04465 [Planctomycetes bacterium]|nr:hypothetical protein [Planctomycetota bacterium]
MRCTRTQLLAASLLGTACATAPRAVPDEELVGNYRFLVGPDQREEFELLPAGRLRWARFSNGLLRQRGAGRWRSSGTEVALDLDGWSFVLHGRSRTVAIRRHLGHACLVRPEDLDWFEAHGPVEEFCFLREGVPVADLDGVRGPGVASGR